MRNTMFAAIAFLAALAGSAHASVQQPSPEQRREIEKRMSELEQQLRDLRHQLGESPRERTRIFGPDIMRVGPGGEVFRVVGGRMKFGFSFEAVPDSGVKVSTVTPSSPAEKLGLKTGDVVTSFNGVKLAGVENPDEELRNVAERIEVGDTVAVEFRRGAERKSGRMIAADLGPNPNLSFNFPDAQRNMEMPKMPEMPGMGVFEWGTVGRWMDMELVSLNKELGEYFGAPEGVLVVRAPRDSSLALRSGDVILSIDGRKPTTPPQALRILRSYERGETFDIVVLRQKKKITVTAKVPDRDTHGYFYDYNTPEPAQRGA